MDYEIIIKNLFSFIFIYFCIIVNFTLKNKIFIFSLIEMHMNIYKIARSISEEFSSGDRFRDDDCGSKTETGGTSGAHSRSESAHKSEKDKDRKDKEKEDKDEGMYKKGTVYGNQ